MIVVERSLVNQLDSPIPGSRSCGVTRRNQGISWSGICSSSSRESSLGLSSDSEDRMSAPGARDIEEIIISDTKSNTGESTKSNSQTIGTGMDPATLEPMLSTAIENISDIVYGRSAE